MFCNFLFSLYVRTFLNRNHRFNALCNIYKTLSRCRIYKSLMFSRGSVCSRGSLPIKLLYTGFVEVLFYSCFDRGRN